MSGRSRRRGFGYVRKLPSGRWQASYLGPDLVRRSASHTFDAKADAEGWLGRRREEVVSGEWQPPVKVERAAALTFDALRDAVAAGVSEETARLWGDNVAFAPDGNQFASAEAGRVRLWDGRSGAYLGGFPLPAPVGETQVAYRPDNHTLLVAARDGRTWTVDTRRSTWVELACRIAGRNLTGAEWEVFFPGRPPEATCAQWPAGS